MSDYLHHLETKVRKRLRLPHSLRELDPELLQKDHVFQAPPWTPELIAAVKLISPQFHLREDEASRIFWEMNQNGSSWGEYLSLQRFIERLGTPRNVLDIGPGLGRSTIFLKKHLRWQAVPFHLYESSGERTKYTRAGPRFDDSFCGSIPVLRQVLEHNEIGIYEVFDAATLGASLARLPGPYHLIFSFFAVGFHWSIEHFLDEILELMQEDSLGFFTLHDKFTDLSCIAHLPHRVVNCQSGWPRGRSWRILVLAKHDSTLHGV